MGLMGSIATAEIGRSKIGWEAPTDAIRKNLEVEGKTWLSKLNDKYYPGDIGFDPTLWSRSCHEEWHEVLRMGKRQGHFEVQQDGLRGCHRSTQCEQLPFQMGGLIKFDGDGGQATESSVRDTVLKCSHSCEC